MSSIVWQIDQKEYPSQGSMAEKIKFLLRYAILAPSAHNTQPWRVEIQEAKLLVFRDPAHTLMVGDPTLRETQLSIGAFAENFILAAKHFGLAGEISAVCESNDPELRLIINLSEQSIVKLGQPDKLFDSLERRHTNRGVYDSTPLSTAFVSELESFGDEDIKVFAISEEKTKERISLLVAKGSKMSLSLNSMRRELSQLVSRESDGLLDGLTVEAMTESDQKLDSGEYWVINSMDPDQIAENDRIGYQTAPLIVIIGTKLDSPSTWLSAGRIMQRCLLLAADSGLNHAISAAPVEIPTLMPQLRQEIDPVYRPQVLFRVGKPLNVDFTRLSARRQL